MVNIDEHKNQLRQEDIASPNRSKPSITNVIAKEEDLFRLIVRKKYEQRKGYCSPYSAMLFLLDGSIQFTDKVNIVTTLFSNQCIFLPKNEPIDVLVLEDARYILLRFHRRTFLPWAEEDELKFFSTESITPCIHPVLDIAPLLANFLNNIFETTELFQSVNYQHIKSAEVHEIARQCYSDRQRAWFCQSIIRPKDDFKAFVEANYDRVKTCPELAVLTGMSEMAFRKKFMQIFGDTVHTWVMKQKAAKVISLIQLGERNIKSLKIAVGITSKTSFIRFTRQWLGGNPSEIVRRFGD